jgi:uncharacterized DUF497 family protein
MRFEWDEEKDRLNQRKHGVSFELASLVFEDEGCFVRPDRIDNETGEQRWQAIGAARIEAVAEALLLVVHVYREGTENGQEIIRIISARAAGKHDVRRYQEQEME